MKKANKYDRAYSKDDMWIAESHSLKWPAPKRGWELRSGESARSNRFLELADVALGVKAAETYRKRKSA